MITNIILGIIILFIITVIQYVFLEIRKNIKRQKIIEQLGNMFGDKAEIRLFLDALFYRCYPYGLKDVILFTEIDVIKNELRFTDSEMKKILSDLQTYNLIHVSSDTTVGFTPFGVEFYKHCFR